MTLYQTDLEKYFSSRLRLSHGSFVNRSSRIKIFCDWLDSEVPTPNDVEDFFFHLKQKGLSNTTLNTYVVSLRTFEKYLIDRNGVEPFMDGFRLYKEEDPNIDALTVEEALLIKNNCMTANNVLDKVRKDITIFLLDTGARWEDAQNLRVKNVNITSREVIYNQLKTQRRRVHIIVNQHLLDCLKNRIGDKSPESLIFTNTAGGPMHYPDYYEWLKAFCKSLGITKRVSPHILRHTYIQNLYDQTRDILLTSNVAGHAEIGSTMRYAKNSKEVIKKAQELHPHIQSDINPHRLIQMIEENIKTYHLEDNSKFDSNKVIKAQMQYLQNLYEAVIVN